MITWLFLQILGLVSSWLLYPNYQWIDSIIDTQEQIQTLYMDEFERNHQAEQKNIIIEDYFLFLKKLGKINYVRWCFGEYTPPVRNYEGNKSMRCSSKSFDCAWLIKAYAVSKWILTSQEASFLNSKWMYGLWTPKDPRNAERWDFTAREWFGDRSTGNYSSHFAMISRDYSWDWILRVYDNVSWDYHNIVWERPLKVVYSNGKFYYMGKYRISVSTNWLYEIAQKKNIEVSPREDMENPEWYKILIKWYPYDSDANRIANYRLSHWWTKYMIWKFMAEAHFNVNAVWWRWERWICQLLPNRTNNVRIDDGRRWSWREFQASVCLDKWNAVPNPDAVRYANAYTELDNIIDI